MALQDEIDKKAATIFTDSYGMSIGEIISLYEGGELDIHPEFQRFFRWTPEQKSRLVESILLGIPLPSIFVAQRKDGVWEVIDGLQRLATIFEFTGILKDSEGKKRDPLTTTRTQHLPSLEGKKWEGRTSRDSLTTTQRLLFKRAKIDVKIIKRQSDEISKYELFQRLNTGGTRLTDQELRNCLLVMTDGEFFRWLRGLSEYEAFQSCLVLTDNAKDEQYDLELAVRFITLRNLPEASLRMVGDLGDFLTESIVTVAESASLDRDAEQSAFQWTFDQLAAALGDDAFRRYDSQKKRFLGGFFVSAFEVLALGAGHHYSKRSKTGGKPLPGLRKLAENLWSNADFKRGARSGMRANERMRITVPLGRKLLKAS